MDLANITPEVVEDCLKALRCGESVPEELLAIPWAAGHSKVANRVKLEDWFHNTIQQVYLAARQVEDLPAIQPANRREALQQIQIDFNSHNSDLEAWSALYFRYDSIVEFGVEELARAANVVPQQFRRRLKQSLSVLTQKLQRAALEAQQNAAGRSQNLPLPDYTRLIGAKDYFAQLTYLFNDPAGPRMVSLEGMGGIGKTALARGFAALPEVNAKWQKILWVSARQAFLTEDGTLLPNADAAGTLEDISVRLAEQMNLTGLANKPLAERLEGLSAALAQEPALVIVDNLETAEEFSQLVPNLAKLAGASRFLFTSRQTLREFPYVYTLNVRELDKARALDLLSNEIRRRGQQRAISDICIDELYDVIGGLPLALKMVAMQIHLRPCHEVAEDFKKVAQDNDTLYRYLYWQTWNSLHDPARQLLLSFLPADAEGEDIDFLRLMSGQPDEVFFEALKELDQFSLLEINGGEERPLYRLHRLTVTFLQTDILKLWSTGQGDKRTSGEQDA
ncbi:protein containg NB-ARC domain [Longilinea arvoryzae]|uniref:Protein containg NB-ARC domain n=1 Tax=Longilinea arvoryzae TaxID=360412 RepID=A0A0S7B7S1_9CHLR|nr:NB-ARC domain-containing protein [Longilinea arvoryzae]GAP13303.1 protein containg NB-ARC domain [Longilinea arvoryzae]